jgi:hypothetical protein
MYCDTYVLCCTVSNCTILVRIRLWIVVAYRRDRPFRDSNKPFVSTDNTSHFILGVTIGNNSSRFHSALFIKVVRVKLYSEPFLGILPMDNMARCSKKTFLRPKKLFSPEYVY